MLSCASLRNKPNHAFLVLEDQAGCSMVDNCADETTVCFGDASVDRSLIVPRQLGFLHAGGANESDCAFSILKNKAGADRYEAVILIALD